MLLVVILAVIATTSTIGFLISVLMIAIIKQYVRDLVVKETLDEDLREAARKVKDRFLNEEVLL